MNVTGCEKWETFVGGPFQAMVERNEYSAYPPDESLLRATSVSAQHFKAADSEIEPELDRSSKGQSSAAATAFAQAAFPPSTDAFDPFGQFEQFTAFTTTTTTQASFPISTHQVSVILYLFFILTIPIYINISIMYKY